MSRLGRVGLTAGGLVTLLVVGALSPAHATDADVSLEVAELPVVAASATTVGSDESKALALALESGEPVAVDESITPTSQISALPTGEMQFEISSVPVRTEDGSGGWVPINTDLVLRDGWWEPTASATPVRFGAGGTDELDQVRTPGGDWLTETWPHGPLPSPAIEGPTATYVEVLPGVDLKLTATELGMASVYVVKSPAAATSEVLTDLHVVLDGAEVSKEVEGTFTAETESGDTITASSPLWWDSSDGGTYVSPGEANPAMPVAHTFSDTGINMDVSETVEAKKPTYPIYIDPDWAAGPYAAWYTDAAYPNQSYLSAGQSDILRVGRFNPYRGNMFFEFGIGALAGKQILSAQLSTTQLGWAACPNSPLQVRTFGIQGAGFTWNQQNHNAWGPVLDTQNPGYCGSGAETVGWNVTSGVQAYAGQWSIQFGFAPQDENVQSRRHYSRAATLYVSYNTPPNTPTDLRFITPSTSCGTEANPAYISATNVTVGFNQTDPDPGNVDTNVDLHKTSDLVNRVQWQNPGLAAQGAKSVTFTGLEDGQAYAWRARGSDWLIDGASYSPWCYFTIDRTGPAAPTFTAPTTQSTVGVASAVTFSTVPSDRVAFIAYTVAPGAGSSSFVFPYFGSAPPCGSVQGTVRIVCPDSSGVATATVVPTDGVSRVLAIPYDVAGNPGVIPGTPAGQPGTVGASFTLTALNSPAVSFANGHAWITQTQTSPLGASIPDTNTTTPIALTLGADAYRTSVANPKAPAIPIPKPVLGFEEIVKHISNIYLAKQPPANGGVPIYKCTAFHYVAVSTLEGNCESRGEVPVLIGYGWSDPTAGSRSDLAAANVCRIPVGTTTTDRDSLSFATCANLVGSAGYVATTPQTGPAWTASGNAVVDSTSSFTVGTWAKPGAGDGTAVISSDASAAGFELGATATNWQFCLRPQAGASVCATTPRAANADWTHLSGVWDAANGEIRLYLRGSLAATTPFTWPSGTPANSRVLNVGATVAGSSVTARWSGLVADPAVFSGVATAAQLRSLADGNDPADG